MSNRDNKENLETNQSNSQEETKPLFGGTDSQGKERLFTSVEEAQKSWQSSQDFIKSKVDETKSLETKVQELEAQLNQSLKLEEALAQLKTKEESPVTEPSQQQTTETTPQVDVEQLKQQLRDEILGSLSDAQKQEVHQSNQQESIAAAQAVFGDSYEEKLRTRAKELDMTDEDIIKEAQSSPKRFKELFGLNKQPKPSYSLASSTSGTAQVKDVELNLGRGFTEKSRVDNNIDNYRKIAEKHNIPIDF